MAIVGGQIMTVLESIEPDAHHVALRGRLDRRSVPDLRVTVHRIVGDGMTPLHLDLAEAQIGDTTGFGFLVECARRASRRGRILRVVAAEDRTVRLLRRARMGHLLAMPTGTVGTLTAL